MSRARRSAIILFGLLVFLVVVTVIALEGSEVVVLHTALDTGEPRATRVWIADYDGAAWIESASPERAFYRDIIANPDAELTRHGERLRYRAVPAAGEEGHQRIRSLLREKYGWRDVWIGMIADTSRSIAIRLEPR